MTIRGLPIYDTRIFAAPGGTEPDPYQNMEFHPDLPQLLPAAATASQHSLLLSSPPVTDKAPKMAIPMIQSGHFALLDSDECVAYYGSGLEYRDFPRCQADVCSVMARAGCSEYSTGIDLIDRHDSSTVQCLSMNDDRVVSNS
jgi:hypothetical protein